MKAMRPLLTAGLLCFLSGCATTMGSASGNERVVVAVDAPASHSSSEVQVTEVVTPALPEAPPPPRRRLSQTVTLGAESYAPAPAPAAANGAGGNGTTVVVNNSVTVVNPAPVYYGGGYYGGSGYGGVGYGGGYGGSGYGGGGHSAGHSPGRGTPPVGGSFAPVPNHGPPAMK